MSIKLEIVKAFQKIGSTSNGKTAPPHSEDNRFAIAYEYFVADLLSSIASKRKDEAKAQALAAGILHTPLPGDTETCFDTAEMQIVGKTNQPASTLDKTALSNELTKLLGHKKATEILTKVTGKSKPATTFTFILK